MKGEAENVPPQAGQTQWDRITASPEFKHLLQTKKLFIIPAFVFFFAYYFSFAALIGYAPKLASTRVIGAITVGYLVALSQFVMGWIIAGLYLLASSRFDALTKDILRRTTLRENDRQGDN